MTAASDKPSDIAFDKMMTAAFDTCDALTDFYCHMEDVRRNTLAGIIGSDAKAGELVGIVHEAHDRYFAAACEYDDLAPCECNTCRAAREAEEAATVVKAVTPDPQPVVLPTPPVVPTVVTGRRLQ